MGLAMGGNLISINLVGFGMPFAMEMFPSGIFVFFGLCNIIMSVYLYLYQVETKGMA
jgi:hypothetical protein